MKLDWFRILIIISLIVLVLNFYYMVKLPLDFPRPEVDISPYTGETIIEAKVYGLRGEEIVELPVVITTDKRNRFLNIMEAYSDSSLTLVESLRINDAYEENNRIYLDVSRNSFSSPGIQDENIRQHVQAIVNSLTSNDRQLPVQFLFDGSIQTETIRGVSFQLPFWRDETVLGYHTGHMREMVAEFLAEIEDEQYSLARQKIYLSEEDRLREGELLHKLRSYRQAKKEAIPRAIEVFTEMDSYLVQVHFTQTGRPEQWTIKVIDKLHYIVYDKSPLDR